MNQDILIFAEQRDGKVQKISYELTGGAEKLAAQTGGRVIALLAGSFKSSALAEQARRLAESGADLVYTVNHPELAEYTPAAYMEVLTKAAAELSPAIFLIGSTSIGIDVAPEVSLRLHTSLVTDCTSLTIDENGVFLMERPGADGISIDIFACTKNRPAMATVRPGVLSALTPSQISRRKGMWDIRELVFSFSVCPRTKLLEVIKGRKHAADITEAKILIAGGRGIGGPEGFSVLRRLADLLGGEIACSRACVEAGWIDTAPQVGQTGKTVRPDLYLACGISGAFQHVTGMARSNLIIAINKNPAAPIFDIADLGIVGNVENVLPALITALEEIRLDALSMPVSKYQVFP